MRTDAKSNVFEQPPPDGVSAAAPLCPWSLNWRPASKAWRLLAPCEAPTGAHIQITTLVKWAWVKSVTPQARL